MLKATQKRERERERDVFSMTEKNSVKIENKQLWQVEESFARKL